MHSRRAEPLRNPSPMPRAASPRPEAPRYASPQKELPKPPSEPPKDQPSPRPVSPARLSLNKELPPVPAARPGSPQKRNSVSPTKGGDRTPEAPPSQELKDVLAKLDEKVRSAARYLVDEQSSLWVQNLDNVRAPNLAICNPLMRRQVEEAIREVKAILANQSKLLGSHSEGRKAQEQQGAWCEKTAELLVKKRTRAAVSQMKAAIAFRQSMLPMSVEKKRIQEAEGHIGTLLLF